MRRKEEGGRRRRRCLLRRRTQAVACPQSAADRDVLAGGDPHDVAVAVQLGAAMYISEFQRQELGTRDDASALVELPVDGAADVVDGPGQHATLFSMPECVERSRRERSTLRTPLSLRL